MRRKIFVCLAVLSSFTVFADFRVWTDRNGNYLEAEFSGVDAKNIILKKKDGRSVLLSPLQLCDEDQQFLRGKISDDLFDPTVSTLDIEKPPRLEIKFKKITDTKNNLNSSSYRDIDLYSAVTITKLNREPYSGKMKAFLYVIGICDRADQFVLLDTASHEFSFDESLRETSFQTGHITIREYRYNTNYSTEYDGYLVVILDEAGDVLTMQSSSSKYEDNYRQLAEFKKGTFFTKRFEVDHVDSDGEYY